MGSIHREKLALFSLPPYNTGEQKITYEDISPSFINQDTYSAISFHIDKQATNYIDLSKTQLHVSLAVQKTDGTDFQKGDNNTLIESVLPIDMILHTMWSSVEVMLNGKLISSAGTDYGYKSAIETYLNYSSTTKRYQLNAIGYSGEDGRAPNATLPNTAPLNNGLNTRYNWFGSDFKNIVEFIGPLNADICKQNRLILNEVEVDIKLWPAKDAFRLICHGTTGKIVIKNIFLRVCKVEVSPEVRLGHASALQIAPARYPYEKVDIRPLTISQGSKGMTFNYLFEGNVPTRIVVGMVKQESYEGEFTSNPLNFEHFNIERIGLEIDNENIPAQPMNFNFAENKYLEGLLSLYDCTNKSWEDIDIGISKNMYKNGVSLIAFNIDPTTSADLNYLGVPRKGNLKLHISFHNSLSKAVTVIVYGIFPARVEIDQSRVVNNYEVQQLIDEIQMSNMKAAAA